MSESKPSAISNKTKYFKLRIDKLEPDGETNEH